MRITTEKCEEKCHYIEEKEHFVKPVVFYIIKETNNQEVQIDRASGNSGIQNG